MFQDIRPEIVARMKWLESRDARERQNGISQARRLRQIPHDTGRFLAMMAAAAPAGNIIEIGASGGYSTLWLILAGMDSNRRVITFEIDDKKVEIARETFRCAGVEERVNLVHGDAKLLLKDHHEIAFCFIDSEKEDYQTLYDLVIPRMVSGGLLVADNIISHSGQLRSFVESARADERIDYVEVPIGKGELLCRKI